MFSKTIDTIVFKTINTYILLPKIVLAKTVNHNSIKLNHKKVKNILKCVIIVQQVMCVTTANIKWPRYM